MNTTRKQIVTKIPVTFEPLQQLDSRFMKIKVWILNIGKNYNGSIFTKEAVMKALPSISLTPILGYIEENDEGAKDFSDHRIVWEVDKNGVHQKYLGSAYGVIPENPNAKFELRMNEYGGMEEYLTVEGLMWTKFDEAINIMNRDTIKFQSMELSEKYDGHFNEEGYFVFTDFQFFGCCILGSNYEPAIPKSTAEKMFTSNELSGIITDKLEEYRKSFEKKEDKDVNHEAIMKEFGVTAEMLQKAGITDIKKYDLEEFKEELRKILDEAKAQGTGADPNPNPEPNPEPNPNVPPNPAPSPDPTPSPSPDPNQDNHEGSFEKEGEKTNADDKKQFNGEHGKVDVNQANEKVEEKDKDYSKGTGKENEIEAIKQQLSELRKDYDKIKSEHENLVEYKATKEKEEHQRAINSKIAEFEALSEDDVKEIRENAHNYSIQQAEDRLFAILGRKASGKDTTSSKFAKFYVNHEKETKNETPVSSYDHYFSKHLKK